MRRKLATDSIITITAIAALALSCDLPPSFGPEYQDSTVNFIAALPLPSAPMPAASDHGTTVPLDALATWDWAWRGNAGPANNFEYMVLTDQGAGTGPGGIGNAWLMETVNLATNSGFGAAPGAMWTGTGLAITNAGAYHGAALQAAGFDSGEYLALSSGLFTDGPSPAETHGYLLSLNTDAPSLTDLKHYSADTAVFDYDMEKTNFQLPGWTAAGINSIPFTEVGSVPGWSLMFIRTSGNLLMDDLTAIRTDKDVKNWSLVLRLSTGDTLPGLVPGTYEFSVYVKKPAGCLFSTEARDSEPYASRFVTLKMIQIVGTTAQTVAERTYDISALADPSVWNRLVLRMNPNSTFSFSESTPGQVVRLSISGLNADGKLLEPGAVLIAEPSLNFYINGY